MIDNNEMPSAADPTADYSKMVTAKMPSNMLANATDTGLSIEPKQEELSIYDQAVNDFDNQRQDALNTSFMSVAGTNPDKASENLRIANQIGVGQDIVSRNEQESKKRNDIMRLQAYDLINKNSVLADLMTDPNFASVAHDDIPQLSGLSTLFKVFAASVPGHGHLFPMEAAAEVYAGFTRGTNTYEYGNIYNEYLRTGNKELALKQKKEVDALSVGLPEAQGFLGSTSEFIGNMVMAQPEAAAYAAAYGVGGLAVGAATGPGALVTGAIGAGAGYMTGMALTAFRVERGAMSLDMLEKGYDEDTVQIVGNIAGSINAALEMTGLKVLSAPARKFATKFITEEILKRTTSEIEKVGLKKLIKETTLEYGKGVFAESATETMQDVVGKLADQVVSLAGTSNLQFNSDGTIQSANPEQSMREFAGQLVDTFIYTAKGAAVLGMFGAGMQIRHNLKQIATAKETTQFLTDLSKNGQAAKLKDRSPKDYANFVAAQAQGTAAETMYVDAEEMTNVLNQSGLTAQQIDNALPGVREQLSKATSGGDIQIPTAQFAANIVGTKLETPLMENARFDPKDISAKQTIARLATREQDIKDAQAEMAVQEVTNAQFVREAKEIEKVVNDELVAAGRPATEALFAAKLVQARAVTGAAAAGITPAQWVAQHPVPTFQSQRQAAQAAQQAPAQGSLEQAAKLTLASVEQSFAELGVEQRLTETATTIRPGIIRVPKELQNQGRATNAMQNLIAYADQSGKRIDISPTGEFGANKKRLVAWYKNLGFVENKGANKDFAISATMYREPRANVGTFGQQDPNILRQEGYRGEHAAPTNDGYAKPLNNLEGIFPDDIYSQDAARLYGTGNEQQDRQAISIIQSAKEKLNQSIKIYRAVPLVLSNAEKIADIQKQKAEIQRRGYERWAKKQKNPLTYDQLSAELDRLKSLPEEIAVEKPQINDGDWVAINKQYAIDHGESALNGKYRIVTKTVPVKHLFTDGNSIQEWGYDSNAEGTLKQSAVPATFYSALGVEVGKSTTKSASADSWKQQIKGLIAKGVVKEKEVYWSGLNNWLDLQEGKITKEQVQAFLDAGGVKVEKTILGDGKAGFGETFYEKDDDGDGMWHVYGERANDKDVYATAEEAKKKSDEYNADIPKYPSKYAEHQLPGGKNYRETLVTLPAKDKTSADIAFRSYQKELRQKYGKDAVILRDATPQEITRLNNLGSPLRGDDSFKSSHWNQENVLVHLRMNDRVDADGKKVLFVEEVQSDWGQAGREKGFVNETRIEIEKLEKQKSQAESDAEPYTNQGKDAPTEIADRWNFAANRLQALRSQEVSAVPTAPFVETTSGWLELGLKQILLEAVNGGYDRVAFVDGDQSVERYRKALTEAVDEVEITRNDNGTYTYSAIKGGKPVQGEQSVSANRINEVFGKAGSKQLLEEADAKPDEIHTIASGDIEIGGEGMRKFYDTIVPQALGKMLKKLGGDKIENVNIITEKPVTQEQINAAEKRKDFTEAERLTAIYERQQLGRGISEKGDQQIGEQQGFTVTPALAAQVSQGLPLFQAAEGGARGAYDPIKNLIDIGKNADYSTVAHELAHWYVVDLFRTASDPSASEASRADADILLNWFGIAGDNVDQRLANWNAMTLDEQRRHHEAVAYNWELYLHTGKAPSVELQGVFDRFRRWLTRAYKSIRDDLNEIYRNQFGTDLPFLTDEVRGVFDRMLASEEQIARREAIDNFKGMYQTQEESGMNDATWAAYQAEIAEAHEMAVTDLTKATVKQMEWLSGARKGILKTMQAAHNALRRSVQGEESNKMDNEPVRKAERFFKTGKMVDPSGKEIEVLVGNKIDSVAVGGMYPTSTTGLAPAVDLTKLRGMTMEGGLAPDLAAEMFGFSSGDELIRALAELKPFKDELKERTDARMLDEHGGMNTEAEKEEAVNKALANEVRARIVAIENRYLTKVKTPVAVIMQGAKELARTILGRMAIKDIKPRNYVAAEAKVAKDKHTAVKAMQSPETAGKSAYTRSFNEQIAAGVEESAAASEALVKSVEAIKRAQAKIDAHKKQYGDVDPAIVAKKASHQQVIQNQLAKEGYKILEEVEKQVSLFKRFFKDDKKIAATRNMDLVNAARSILAFYGLGKHDKLPSAYLDQIQKYNPGLFETISAMVNEAKVGTPDYESLTFEEFQSMQETVDALWQLAKRENQIKIEGEMVSLGQATEKLEKRMDVVGVPTTIAGETQAVTSKDRAVRHINSMKAILRRVEHWADSIDGAGNVGGPFTKYIWRPISQALDAYRIDRNKYVKRYVELLKQVPLPAGKIAAPELNYTFGAGNGGIGIAELLGAIMHSGNISNLEKLLIGRKWATVSEDGTMDTSRWDAFMARVSNDGTVTKEHFDFIQAVWDLNEELKPMVQKAHYDIEGYYFKEVEATPFTNRFGTYRGGYVPAKTDPFIVRDAQRQAKMSELESDFRAAMPSTGAGFTKSRVKYNKALSLDIRLMAKHIDDVIRYSHVQPAVKDVLRILKKSSFADKLTQMDSMAIDEMLTPWLNRAARQITSESGRWKPIDTFWRTVRSRTGISVMIGNITNALQQATGLFMSSIKVKPVILGNALYAYFSSPRLAAQEVAALSPFMSNRMENQIFDLQDQMNQLILNPNKFQKIQKWSSHHGYFLQSAFQNMVDVVTWTGAYNQYLAESGVGMSDADAQREAVNRADAAVRLTQGTMNPEGLAAFEVGTPFYKTFVQFTGYFNMLANLNTDEYVKIFRDLGWRGNEGKLAYTFLMGFAAQAIISDAIVRTMRGGWEDEDDDGYLDVFMDWIFGSMARSAVAMVPFGSSAYTALTTAYNNKPYDDRITSSPSISALESSTVGVGKAIINVVSEDKEITGQNVKDVMTLISLTTGIPVTLLGRPVSYLVDVNRGKVEPTSTADYMRGLITGTATKESKKR